MGEPKTLEEAMDIFWRTARGIMIEKRHLRGSENIANQGLYGVLNRVMEDKVARIRRTVNDLDLRGRMADRGIPQSTIDEYIPDPCSEEIGEALEDDLIDSANYFLIAWLLWKGWWELPLISKLAPTGGEEVPYHCICPNCGKEFTAMGTPTSPPQTVVCSHCGHTCSESLLYWEV